MNHGVFRSCVSLFWPLLAVFSSVCVARPGSPDPDFNAGLAVRVVIDGSINAADAVFSLPENKILIAGLCSGGTAVAGCAVRLDATGAVDSSYGTNGLAKLPSFQVFFSITGFALQPDGKLVVGGACSTVESGWQFCASRFNTDGLLDVGFGSGGLALAIAPGTNNGAWAVASQDDGRILLSGQCREAGGPMLFCTVRLNSNGAVDANFGATGFAFLPGGAGYQAKAVAVQSDGKILVTGLCKQTAAPARDFCLQRYRPDGSIDLSFGTGGEAIAGRSDLDPRTTRVAVQPDSKYLVAAEGLMVRFTESGALDATFGVGGLASGASGDFGVHLQPDGKILAGCGGTGLCAARLRDDGSLDTSFGFGGMAQLIPTVGVGNSARALQADGHILAAGRCASLTIPGQADFCVTRFLGGPYGYENCKPDLDGDGVFTATVDGLIFTRIALGITGEVVLSGITFAANATRNNWPKVRAYLRSNCGLKLP